MSVVRREQASEMRSPAPYAVVNSARCFSERRFASSRSTSSRLSTSGSFSGTFGYGIEASIIGLFSVTP